jgi:branched-chain amino acid transport system permease protein
MRALTAEPLREGLYLAHSGDRRHHELPTVPSAPFACDIRRGGVFSHSLGGLIMFQAILSGVLVGGVYGLFSMGFSLAFGVMRIINFAHGELVMVGMYIGYVALAVFGIDPLYAIPLSFVLVGLLGALMYEVGYRHFVGKTTLQQLLVAIALALIIQASAQIIFGPDARAVRSGWSGQYLLIGTIFMSYAQIAAFTLAVCAVVVVELVLRLTPWGQQMRAIADDAETAELVGVDSRRINITAFAFSCALAGIAGTVLVTYYPVSPVTGFALMPIALIATVVGGLGSVGGAFIGGIACGIVQQLTSAYWTSALQDVPLYLLLLVFFAVRPHGLFGRQAAP